MQAEAVQTEHAEAPAQERKKTFKSDLIYLRLEREAAAIACSGAEGA
jgi:hypothetical protein